MRLSVVSLDTGTVRLTGVGVKEVVSLWVPVHDVRVGG
jgi:hypothetical protein